LLKGITGKALNKPRKIIINCEIDSIDSSITIHNERRRFLQRILNKLYTTIEHTPGIIAPKCSTILTALALTKSEIIWYYQHKTNLLSSKKLIKKLNNNHKNPNNNSDLNISTLMHLMYKITKHIRSHRMLVGRYYHEYLRTTHVDALNEMIDVSKNTHHVIQSFITSLSSLPLGETYHVNVTIDLRPIRMEWYRHETKRIFDTGDNNSGGLVLQRASMSRLSSVVERMLSHTTWIDELENIIRLICDLHTLYWLPNEVDHEYQNCLTSPTSKSSHIISFLKIYSSAAKNLYNEKYYSEDVIPMKSCQKVNGTFLILILDKKNIV
jgi:hypothetical protein